MRSLWLVVFCCVIVGCSNKEKPVLNPHPKVFYTISGKISPDFKPRVYLSFLMSYVSNNPKCATVSNPLAGLKESRGRTKMYLVMPNAEGYYKVQIPLDKYLPGYCEWGPYQVYYKFDKSRLNVLNKSGITSLASFEKEASSNNSRNISWICKNIGDCKLKGDAGKFVILTASRGLSDHIRFNLLSAGGVDE